MYRFVFMIELALLVVPTPTLAYELMTHARMTPKAFDQSIISEPETLSLYGLSREKSLGKTYYDASTWWPFSPNRKANIFEDDQMPDGDTINPYTPRAWMSRGAIREDDNIFDVRSDVNQPLSWNLMRVANHFYDPYKYRELHSTTLDLLTDYSTQNLARIITGLSSGAPKTSVEWALGTDDVYNQEYLLDSNSNSGYTIQNAREAMSGSLLAT